MGDKDEDAFKAVVEIVSDVVMEHPSTTFDVTVADCLKLRNFYAKLQSIVLDIKTNVSCLKIRAINIANKTRQVASILVAHMQGI